MEAEITPYSVTAHVYWYLFALRRNMGCDKQWHDHTDHLVSDGITLRIRTPESMCQILTFQLELLFQEIAEQDLDDCCTFI